MSMSLDLARLARQAADEVADAAGAIREADYDALAQAITEAQRVILYGVGREGLMMRALAMRLYHLGLDAHVVGEMSAPPVGAGDLLLVSAGPGHFSTVAALVAIANDAGARTACVTAQPSGPVPRAADVVFTIPSQTMADDIAGPDEDAAAPRSVLPMGSLYEGAQYVAFEVLVLLLKERLGVDAMAMRNRHTNLE